MQLSAFRNIRRPHRMSVTPVFGYVKGGGG